MNKENSAHFNFFNSIFNAIVESSSSCFKIVLHPLSCIGRTLKAVDTHYYCWFGSNFDPYLVLNGRIKVSKGVKKLTMATTYYTYNSEYGPQSKSSFECLVAWRWLCIFNCCVRRSQVDLFVIMLFYYWLFECLRGYSKTTLTKGSWLVVLLMSTLLNKPI